MNRFIKINEELIKLIFDYGYISISSILMILNNDLYLEKKNDIDYKLGPIDKFYQIICSKGNVLQQGKITGFTQRTCLYVGDLKNGNYTLKLDETESKDFIVQ